MIDGRIFSCRYCHTTVIICRSCDRGQKYCSKTCAESQKKIIAREASMRYQNTVRGRHQHAERQKRLRERVKELLKKVTHVTSKRQKPYVLLKTKMKAPANSRQNELKKCSMPYCCQLCGCLVDRLREDFITTRVK